MTYAKPALWLHTLERALGWTTMQQVLATFFERWKFKHPRPGDLFQVANEVSRQRSHAVLRSGVSRIRGLRLRRRKRHEHRETDDGAFVSEIVVRRHGDGIFPVTDPRDARQRRTAPLCVGRRRPLAPSDARAREPRRVGAGRSRPDSAARHEFHEQQLHNRAAEPGAPRPNGRRPGWCGCRISCSPGRFSSNP